MSRSDPPTATSLVIHTVDVVKALKPSSHGVVADALHHTLHYSLDGLRQDWEAPQDSAAPQQPDCSGGGGGAAASSSSSSTRTYTIPVEADADTAHTQTRTVTVRSGFVPNPVPHLAPHRPFISYAYDAAARRLALPHPATVPDPLKADPCGPDNRDAHDVSAKFFFLGGGEGEADADADADAEAVDEALRELRTSTGILTVDTLVLAFEDITRRWGSGEGEASSSSAAFDRDVARIQRVWTALSQSPYVQSLGLADVPLAILQALFPAPSGSASASTPQPTPTPPHVPSEKRLPRVLALSASRHAPCAGTASTEERQGLKAWCEAWNAAEGQAQIQMLSHSDPQEILPPASLPALLDEFDDALPVQLAAGAPNTRARWCLRYTVLIRDRGVLADRGYVVCCA